MAIEKFRRYLTSQHFGRVVATVSFESGSGGVVKLSRQSASYPPMEFTFPTGVRELLSDLDEDWHELLIRLAVFQAHRGITKSILCPESQALDIGGTLWFGDLLLAPYGGATTGVEMREKLNNYRFSI